MAFYFGLGSDKARNQVLGHLQQMSAACGQEAQGAISELESVLSSALASGEVDAGEFHKVIAVFALAILLRNSDPSEDLFALADDAATPIKFDKESQWHEYMLKAQIIPVDRNDEANALLVAFGAFQPFLDLSALANAAPVVDEDFCC
jgi:hypothetical protein